MDKPHRKVDLGDFKGLYSDPSPHKIGAGAQVMDNITLAVPGQLTARRGMRAVTFSGGGSSDTQDALYASTLIRPDYHYCLYVTTAGVQNDGEVRLGRSPT